MAINPENKLITSSNLFQRDNLNNFIVQISLEEERLFYGIKFFKIRLIIITVAEQDHERIRETIFHSH